MCCSVYCRTLCACLEGVDISSVDNIVLSIISLVVNTCSVVDLLLRYAAWLKETLVDPFHQPIKC